MYVLKWGEYLGSARPPVIRGKLSDSQQRRFNNTVCDFRWW